MTWRAFLKNYASQIAAIDFFAVPPATFRILYGFVVLEHSTRRIIHFTVRANPSTQWAAIQVAQAFPWVSAPKYLLRDRDGICCDAFKNRIKGMGIEERLISFRCPWPSAHLDRLNREFVPQTSSCFTPLFSRVIMRESFRDTHGRGMSPPPFCGAERCLDESQRESDCRPGTETA